jgi:hypothetical protein
MPERGIDDLDDHWRYHVGFGYLEALDVAHPGFKFEAPHDVSFHAAAERASVGSRDVADVEHGGTEESYNL